MNSNLLGLSPLDYLAQEIVKIINNPSSFTNKNEEQIEADLVSAYRTFAEKCGFGLEIGARGMRYGLGALCGRPPDSYVVWGHGGSELEIWVNADKRVQVTVEEERAEIGEGLKKVLETYGIKVIFLTPAEKKRSIENYRKMLERVDDLLDFRH